MVEANHRDMRALIVNFILMAASYHRTFSRLARDYGVYIAAGSIMLTAPYVEDGVLFVGKGMPANVAVL
jgi:hypothetical protein